KQLKLDLANAKRNHSGDTEGFWKAFNHAFDKHTAALGAIEDWRTAHLMGAPDSEAGKRGYAQGNTRTALIKDKIAGLVGEALISAVGAVALRALIAGRVARVKSGCFVSGTVV